MKDLIEKCKKAIETEKCLGCQALENPNFKGNSNCMYLKTFIAAESIRQIHKNLERRDK